MAICEIVYIEITSLGATGGKWSVLQQQRCQESIESSGVMRGIDAPGVVALKSAKLKTKQFKDGNFTDLADYVKRELAARSPKTYYDYNVRQFGVFKKMHEHMQQDDIAAMMELVESHSNSEIADWASSLNKDRVKRCRHGEGHYNSGHDGASFTSSTRCLHSWPDWEMQSTDKEYQTKIANYIGGTIRENQE